MSLRLRLLVVVTLAGIALGIAIATVVQLTDARASLAIGEAEKSDQLALSRLGSPPHPTDHEAARAQARLAMGPVVETRGGYCWPSGEFVEEMSASFRDQPPGPPPPGHGDRGPGPPPKTRAALETMCKAQAPEVAQQNLQIHGQITVLQVRAIGDGVAAFAMRIVPGGEAESRWPPGVIALTLLTLVMIAITVHALISIRRGARVLTTAVGLLESDLRTEVAVPSVPELATIAVGLRGMAHRLAAAREREVALERQVAHGKRMVSLGHLVAGISHEIRNPLTGVRLLLDGIARREGDPRTREEVDLALREVARLDKLVASTLGVARDTEITLLQLDLAALVDERISVAAAHARTRSVTLIRRGTGSQLADREALVRVLDNLVRNAIDASPEGGTVDVAIDERTIDVIDRGPGVAAPEGLFEPFVTTKPDGTGLGLWMSLALAEARGGTLRYRRQDAMTHFTIELG